MGAKDERMLMQKFIDVGFGAFRYPQPAIALKEKYQKADFKFVRRAQPVDFLVNGKLNITMADGSNRKMFFRLGVEEKTTGSYSYVRSNIDDKSHVKFIEFCRKNCLIPAYLVVFRKTEYAFKYHYHLGNDKPYSLREDESYIMFDQFLGALLNDYIEIHDFYNDMFDDIEIDCRGDEDGGDGTGTTEKST